MTGGGGIIQLRNTTLQHESQLLKHLFTCTSQKKQTPEKICVWKWCELFLFWRYFTIYRGLIFFVVRACFPRHSINTQFFSLPSYSLNKPSVCARCGFFSSSSSTPTFVVWRPMADKRPFFLIQFDCSFWVALQSLGSAVPGATPPYILRFMRAHIQNADRQRKEPISSTILKIKRREKSNYRETKRVPASTMCSSISIHRQEIYRHQKTSYHIDESPNNERGRCFGGHTI